MAQLNWQEYLPYFQHSVTLEQYFVTNERWPQLTDQERSYHLFYKTMVHTVERYDNGEPLVHLPSYFVERDLSVHFQGGGEAAYGAQSGDIELRRGVAERLVQAVRLIQAETDGRWTIKVTDGYRPMELQRRYFNEVYAKLKASGLSGDELYNRTVMVIADPEKLPPHTTGGAIDLTLFDREHEQEVPMGTIVDEVDHPDIYMFSNRISVELQRNRAILYAAMIAAGFVNCASEWWHYSYGDAEWALRSNQPRTLYTPL